MIREEEVFQEDYGKESLHNHFQVNSLKGFGVDELTEGLIAAGAVLYYLSETVSITLKKLFVAPKMNDNVFVILPNGSGISSIINADGGNC